MIASPRVALFVVAAVLLATVVSGCAPATRASGGSPHARTSPAPPTKLPKPVDPIAHLSLEQRVGQLFMVGTTASGAEQVTIDAITKHNVGSIFLSGRSHGGVGATAAVVDRFRALVSSTTTGGEQLLVATDQEGGEVQVLQGPGFAAMPTGLTQGQLSAHALESDARTWGSELTSAGVNMDLAPVVDLLPSAASAVHNPPIGAFKREYGFSLPTIVEHATAFRDGMDASNVITVMKHFPGLGFVTQNTDTARNVTDTVTSADGDAVAIYRDEIARGADCIMVSSAVYRRIAPGKPAVFSSAVVTALLRKQLGFNGVVISDDLSASEAVDQWSPAQRAILAIEAGVDIVLVSADPAVAAQMVEAVVTKARTDQAFAALVDAAARRVVLLKARDGLSATPNGSLVQNARGARRL
ncbi:MAG TPA: glycoside hydrolase family 3 N-terminal domain-containing protein [Galbitalea sp.]|nr:glycoside hydrolase family 3 N-terminal domain-containing protein [Galbitalea sp.]